MEYIGSNSLNLSIFNACLPWAILLIVGVLAARGLVALSGAELRLARLRSFHRSQEGSVQSLSFVLTLPFFVMILMMIIQTSQIMFGNILVHYSAFAAVRSATVWIPANVNVYETTNRISTMTLVDSNTQGQRYLIEPGSQKFAKIQQAAILACMSLGPSRDLGYPLAPDSDSTHNALVKLYQGTNPNSRSNGRIATRLRNKLAYTIANTSVRLTFWHRNRLFAEVWRDPALQIRYNIPPYQDEYYMNEVGWQDELTAQVTFQLPLLPGPIRFLAPTGILDSGQSVGSAPPVDDSGEAYIWPLTASATMGVEGEKNLISIWQEEYR